jgi:copper(I)-binding protein
MHIYRTAIAALGLQALLGCSPPAGGDLAQPGLAVTHPWTRPTVGGMSMGVAYFDIENRGRSADTLLAVSSPVADSAELHRSIIEDGMARMRPAGEIVIAPGATVKAEPEGLHVMLHGLKQPLVAGSQVPLTLTFSSAGEITVQLDVRPNTP